MHNKCLDLKKKEGIRWANKQYTTPLLPQKHTTSCGKRNDFTINLINETLVIFIHSC